MRRDWVVLGAEILYAGYLSYAVVDLLGSDLTPRVRAALIIGWIIILAAALAVAGIIIAQKGEWLYRLFERFTLRIQSWSPWARGLVYIALLATSALLSYTNISRGLMDDERLRYALLFAILVIAVQFWPLQTPLSLAGRALVTLLAIAYALLGGDYLKFVVDYPFSLSWSEGNRFYDYSLIFGKSLYRYGGNLSSPYYSPGRYALWGLWFLIPGLPIAFHRFWNALLWIVPPVLLGWLLGRGISQQPGLRLGLALWIGLFLSQGPIYAPILLAASLIIFFDRARLWQRGLSIAVASLYAGLSRWTWFGAAGAWSGLLELSSHESYPQRPLIRRLGAVLLVVLAGSLPGLLANWTRFAVPKQSTLSLSQPLLWYRLFPNATFKTGILPGLGLAAGPLLLILAWLAISRRWKLDWLQGIAIAGVLGVTLVAGLVASVKIGGGSNLHNLDMFLITLSFLAMMYLDQVNKAHETEGQLAQQSTGLDLFAWPVYAKGVVVVASLMLVWPYFSDVRRLVLPPQGDVQRSIQNLRQQVQNYKSQGEVLFLDQRQLLTFGMVEDVPLIPEYEKKYLMDQAMAGNVTYFQGFYQDLVNKRFALIVSEPLYRSYDDAFDPFSEENNAWVQWVSEAILCFYTPEKTYKEVRVQLLVPRAGSLDCELPLK